MQQLNITVTNGTAFNESNETSVLSITVTNTNAIPCAPGTDAYYYVSLTDADDNSDAYTFVVAAPGTIAADTEQNFVVENTSLGAVTSSTGVIYYSAE